jgi:hypothetical protein
MRGYYSVTSSAAEIYVIVEGLKYARLFALPVYQSPAREDRRCDSTSEAKKLHCFPATCSQLMRLMYILLDQNDMLSTTSSLLFHTLWLVYARFEESWKECMTINAGHSGSALDSADSCLGNVC